MKKAKQYLVLSAEEIEALEVEVEKHLADGWKCQGGIAQGANEYLQAMVK